MLNIVPFLLKNKLPIAIILAILGALSYHTYKVLTLEGVIDDQTTEISTLEANLGIVKNNFSHCSTVNTENNITITAYQQDFEVLQKNNKVILSSHKSQILRLRATIADLKQDITYPEILEYDKCVVKVRTKDDIDENDTTFYNLLRIGY